MKSWNSAGHEATLVSNPDPSYLRTAGRVLVMQYTQRCGDRRSGFETRDYILYSTKAYNLRAGCCVFCVCRLAEREIVKLAKKKEVEIQHVRRRVLEHLIRSTVHEVSYM